MPITVAARITRTRGRYPWLVSFGAHTVINVPLESHRLVSRRNICDRSDTAGRVGLLGRYGVVASDAVLDAVAIALLS
jgi:hypothetical protein